MPIKQIKAYIRKLFFKSRLCSWSGFISCSNFRINILGKDALDLYGLVFKIEFNLIIQKKKITTFGSARCQGFSQGSILLSFLLFYGLMVGKYALICAMEIQKIHMVVHIFSGFALFTESECIAELNPSASC